MSYSKIPKILSQYEIALMPYQNKVRGRSSIWLEKYMSPLKMFDYLASKKIIIASDLNVYKHILKNNFNSKLIKVNDDKKWSKAIQSSFEKNKKNDLIKITMLFKLQKSTRDKRVQKIIIFTNKSLNI